MDSGDEHNLGRHINFKRERNSPIDFLINASVVPTLVEFSVVSTSKPNI
jgi:hypothetical protein